MTVEPTYRIAELGPRDSMKEWAEGVINISIREKVLVPDSRLQDIADAWKAIEFVMPETWYDNRMALNTLTGLLDALTQEDTHKERVDQANERIANSLDRIEKRLERDALTQEDNDADKSN